MNVGRNIPNLYSFISFVDSKAYPWLCCRKETQISRYGIYTRRIIFNPLTKPSFKRKFNFLCPFCISTEQVGISKLRSFKQCFSAESQIPKTQTSCLELWSVCFLTKYMYTCIIRNCLLGSDGSIELLVQGLQWHYLHLSAAILWIPLNICQLLRERCGPQLVGRRRLLQACLVIRASVSEAKFYSVHLFR